MKFKVFRRRITTYLIVLFVVLTLGSIVWYKDWQSKFEAPRQDTQPIDFTIGKNFIGIV